MICGGHSGEVVPFDIIPFFRGQKQVIGSFVYTRDGGREVPRARAARARSCRSSTRRSRSSEAREAMATMERREHFGKIVLHARQAGASMKRLGVDVGGTFTDLIYVDDEAGADPRPQAADDARRPVAGHGAGDQRADRERGLDAGRARPGLPRDDDRDEHRDRAQRRPGRADHDRGLPRHPPHRAAQEAAQLLELPGPAVAARTRSCAAATG